MKGNWDILTNNVGGSPWYQVYRLRDAGEVMHSGNMEIDSGYETRDEAETRLHDLNIREGLHRWVASYTVREVKDEVVTGADYVTAVYARNIKEALNEALEFGSAYHRKDGSEIFITEIGIADHTAGLWREASKDTLGDGYWPGE